jgi:NAD(P)-dependent dehydrogenase (short-subunit alcohol dehydrogenase family)
MQPPDGLGTVIVTGGASGLGAATARAVRDAAGTAVVLDRNEPEDGFDRELVDLAFPREAEQAVAHVLDRHDDVRGVVTAAAIDVPGRLDDVAGDMWDRIVTINLLGTAAVVRAALPVLERNAGRVVTVASTLAHKAVSDATAYCASKFGVIGFSRALADETAGRVGVTMLSPGGMATHFFDARDERYKPPPDATLNDPAHVAQAILFALRQPAGCELRELVITPAVESSWPP